MSPETTSTVLSLLETLVWPLFILLAVLVIRRELKMALERVLTARDLDLSIGPMSLQAHAMKDVLDSIDAEFPEKTIEKSEIGALIEDKLRGIQGKIEYTATGSNTRSGQRHRCKERITIKRKGGETVSAGLVDISGTGVGFESDASLSRGEIIGITRVDRGENLPVSVPKSVRIVRKVLDPAGFRYGAKLSTSTVL